MQMVKKESVCVCVCVCQGVCAFLCGLAEGLNPALIISAMLTEADGSISQSIV
jgi:hypothetical protein